MDTIEYRTIDKSAWPRGPWDNEPDKRQWSDIATGLPCLAVRGPGGNWCGYVGIAEGHPYFAMDYDHASVEVHGGLTFSDFCAHGAEASNICHVPGPGEPDRVWWLGFDCAHFGDFSPQYDNSPNDEGIYRDLSYVTDQCVSLAAQLAKSLPKPEQEKAT